jgi:hypothetical protein
MGSTEAKSPASVEQYNETYLPTWQTPPNELLVKITRTEELHLMIHYINSTCETMSHGPDLTVWKIAIPEEAVRYDFLMDGLLALSSLHLAFKNPGVNRRYAQIALHYQNVGLRRYTNALKHISTDNSHALFAYAVITTVMTLAVPGSHQQMDLPDCITSLVSMFELLQGVRIIGDASRESLRTGKFGPLFREIPLDIERPVAAPNVLNAMLDLRERAGTVAKYVQPDKHGVYLSGIEGLELVFGSVATSNHLGPIMAWPAMINKKLLEFFKQGDPMAQLIFLHYGVLLLYTHDRWWGRSFGLRLIDSLAASLSAIDAEWASWTRWVKDSAALVMQEMQLRSAQHTPSCRENTL